MPFDKEDFVKAMRRLKRCVIGAYICLAGFFIFIIWLAITRNNPNPDFLKNPIAVKVDIILFILGGFSYFLAIFYWIEIIFRTGFVLRRMNKGAILWQLLLFFMPLTAFGLPVIFLNNAKQYLASQEKINNQV